MTCFHVCSKKSGGFQSHACGYAQFKRKLGTVWNYCSSKIHKNVVKCLDCITYSKVFIQLWFQQMSEQRGEKPPPCNKTSVCFQTSHAKVFMVVSGYMYVFFPQAFVKTTYLFKKASFCLMQFAAALSALADFQLKVEDTFSHWGHLFLNPTHQFKKTGGGGGGNTAKHLDPSGYVWNVTIIWTSGQDGNRHQSVREMVDLPLLWLFLDGPEVLVCLMIYAWLSFSSSAFLPHSPSPPSQWGFPSPPVTATPPLLSLLATLSSNTIFP